MKQRKWLALLLAVCVALPLISCRRSGDQIVVRYDLTAAPRSLDPQLASTGEALMIVENTFEGLLRQSENGGLEPGVATDYEVSDDGLTYTFTLRRDAMWSDGETPVTARDFVFAFRRVVDPVTGSAGAANFLCVQNAPEILSGAVPASRLGVSAPDDYTLIVRLHTPNPFFAEVTASAAAMPCNEAFFTSTKGRYGLDPEYLMFNGPFFIRSYDAKSKVSLRPNEHYRSAKPVLAAGVDLAFQYDDRFDEDKPDATLKTAAQKVLSRFYSGKTDAAPISFEEAETLQEKGSATVYSFENTVWGLAFNCRTNTYGNDKIRRALLLSIDPQELSGYLTGNLSPARGIVPPAVKLLDRSYRDIAGNNVWPARDSAQAKALLTEGLAELGVEKLSKTTILYPDGYDFAPMLSILQRQLQQGLGVFINLEALPQDELSARVRSGDYLLALVPYTAERSNPDSILSRFAGYSTRNETGYASSAFDNTLSAALVAGDIVEAAELYERAEQALLEAGVYLPLAYETSHYACSADVQGLVFSPFSYQVYFKYAAPAE